MNIMCNWGQRKRVLHALLDHSENLCIRTTGGVGPRWAKSRCICKFLRCYLYVRHSFQTVIWNVEWGRRMSSQCTEQRNVSGFPLVTQRSASLCSHAGAEVRPVCVSCMACGLHWLYLLCTDASDNEVSILNWSDLFELHAALLALRVLMCWNVFN